jgi:hypothetical protein
MAFTSAILGTSNMGSKKMSWGSWTTDTTTGAIKTGLAVIENFQLCPNKSAVAGNQCVVDETFPLNTDGVTIVIDSGVDGYWFAIGQ